MTNPQSYYQGKNLNHEGVNRNAKAARPGYSQVDKHYLEYWQQDHVKTRVANRAEWHAAEKAAKDAKRAARVAAYKAQRELEQQ